ncbi:hypothetical protein HYPSUDRAFT_146170 [Hypholoma sublateritium FD-334 SS-4]|uniref:Cytochrome P450 n=1 Tax=Hypholoma sublateritium (strain FD-334 SS-4) TaxID=945553 RepID=A0A0D2NM21_HYPSF|nr:hypothetical protein HYPSUDRAFT_146170 [Hypholoma sublateritium FD-334 SS-4]
MTDTSLSAAPVSPSQAAAYVILAICLYLVVRKRRIQCLANPRRLPYPPGPRPYPVIGNMLDIAKINETTTYQHLADTYGDLVFLSALGRHILVLNSFETAKELLDKRSVNYSDRPQSTMSHELLGWDFSFAHMPYGDRWRTHRRLFHDQFQQSIAPAYWPIQQREAHALLRRLLHSPEKLDYHLRHNIAAVIMDITYGITIADHDDQYITMAEKALEGAGQAASPGAFLVDIIPFLKYVPEWVPGASFKRKAREWRRAVLQMRDAPFATTLQNMRNGTSTPCFVSTLLEEYEMKGGRQDSTEAIKDCAGMVFAAAAESTVSTLASFILAVLTHPEVQSKAQEEIDRVVGNGRLPDFSDRSELPYIDAILKEVLRWNPVAPLGLPHMATQHDQYNGYFIPAGTIVVGNTWRILNDPKLFPNPRHFDPGRFLGKHNTGDYQCILLTETLSSAFGYGRRVCPGRQVGEAQVWISIACILSVFTIAPALDSAGLPIEVKPAFSSQGMIWCAHHPSPFKFSMKPRNEFSLSLVEQTTELTL